MLSSMFESSSIPLLEQVVNFTEARHGVLAGNIANLDTPGYRTRDLSPTLFRDRLQEAVEAQRAPHSQTDGYGNYGPSSAIGGSRADRNLDAFQQVKGSLKSILRHDDNNVSMEQQISEIVKNQTEHNLAVSIMTAQFRLLRAAITERVA
jgi:flagellar basal-body rod protein FlgB